MPLRRKLPIRCRFQRNGSCSEPDNAVRRPVNSNSALLAVASDLWSNRAVSGDRVLDAAIHGAITGAIGGGLGAAISDGSRQRQWALPIGATVGGLLGGVLAGC